MPRVVIMQRLREEAQDDRPPTEDQAASDDRAVLVSPAADEEGLEVEVEATPLEKALLIGGMSPLQFTMMTLVLCNEAIGTTMLFPYVGFLVAKVDGSNDRSAAGYYSGLLVGTFQLGQMFFSARWGYVSDCVGRRPVFIIGLLCGGFFVICFGLSPKLWMLMLFRLLHGVTCANAAVGKTYTAEVVTGANRAKAFGTMSLSWAVGSLIGPTIGGFLYDPCTNSVLSQLEPFSSCDGVFGEFPALLPSITLAVYSFSSAIAIYFFLPESNARAVPIGRWASTIAGQWRDAAKCTLSWLAPSSARHVAGFGFTPLPRTDGNADDDGNGGNENENEDDCKTESPVEEEAAAVVALEGAIQPPTQSFAAAAMASHNQHHLQQQQQHHLRHPSSPKSPRALTNEFFEMRELPPSGSTGREQDGSGAVDDEERTKGGEDPRGSFDDLETLADDRLSSCDDTQSQDVARLDQRQDQRVAGDVMMPSVDSSAQGDQGDEDVFTWTQLARHPVLSRVIPMYMALCAYNISFAEIMPLYAIAFLKDGGLQLSSSDVGIIFAANAVMSLGANLAFGYVAERVKYLRLWRISCFVYACTIPLMGTASLVSTWSEHNVTLVLGLLIFLSLFRVTTSGFQFSLCMMFVANGAPPRHLGRVTGMSHACGSISRSVAPVLAAPLFAWSISNGDQHVFPANHYFLFVLCSCASLFAYWLSTRLEEEDVMHKPAAGAKP